jgi:carboxymethylenebutenolidase
MRQRNYHWIPRRRAPGGRLLLNILAGVLFSGAIAAEVVTSDVGYASDPEITGFLARPDDAAAHPAVILIHDWWGRTDYMHGIARSYAEQGYVALAVDLYQGKVAATIKEASQLSGSVRKDTETAFDNLGQAVAFLEGLTEHVQGGRIASVGWCFGGGWSYQMARNDLGVKASVIYYGFFNPADDLSKMRAQILGHFGEEDRLIKVDNVREFQARLKTLKGDHEIYIYPNAGHAFAKTTSESYNPEAAELAWRRTMEFLEKTL